MQRIRKLIHEVHRRSLWQVVGIYVLGSWAAYEVIAEVTDRMGLPGWVPGLAIVLFLIGLPIVVATAFVQEGLPGQALRRPLSTGAVDLTLAPELPAEAGSGDARTESAPGPRAARPHVFLTWQRSVLAGITAFLLLGITAGGYIGLRNAGVRPFASLITSGELDARDRIILAQLEHAGGDTITAEAVTEALRVDLAQSPVLTVVEARFIGDALQRMGRARDERLDGALAREVAIREGAKAVLEGEISPAGSGYIITARLLRASTGEMLVSHRENATGSDQIITAIDRMSRKLRERIGESLRTVRADAPLEAVTTSSLTALQKYTQGARALDVERDYDRAIPLLQESIAEDSTFAMAWRKLAVAYYNTRAGRDRLQHAATRAYELRDRLTERERYHTLAFYHLNVTGDEAAAITAYRSLLDIYPNDHAANNNLALVYGRVRDMDGAAEYYRRAITVDSFAASSWTNLVMTEYRRGNRDTARALLKEATRRFPQHRDNRSFAANVAHADGAYDEADRILRELLAETRGSEIWRARANFELSNLLLTRGRLAEAKRHIAEALAAQQARGVRGMAIMVERRHADVEQWLLQRPDLALRRLDALLASTEWQNTPAANRNYLEIAHSYARSGNAVKARQLVAQWDALPQDERGEAIWEREAADGWIALAEDRATDAIEPLRRAASVGECVVCNLASVAVAFDAAAMPDSAIAYYRRYIETPDMMHAMSDAWELAPSYERLAELYEAAGDVTSAKRYAALLVDLWKNADPELQPRVRRKQEMLQRHAER